MVFNPVDNTVTFDRTASGITDFSQDFSSVVSAPTVRKSATQSLRIFVDRSSIEIFDDEGNFVMTNLVFPTVPYSLISLAAENGKASLKSMDIYSLNPAQNN